MLQDPHFNHIREGAKESAGLARVGAFVSIAGGMSSHFVGKLPRATTPPGYERIHPRAAIDVALIETLIQTTGTHPLAAAAPARRVPNRVSPSKNENPDSTGANGQNRADP